MRNALRRLWLVLAVGSGLSATAAQAQLQINEDFATVPPAGWVIINHSQPLGATDWFQGNDGVFPAQSGASTSYAAADYNNTTGTGIISDWLLTPPVNLANGTTLSFYTRAVDPIPPTPYPDRMQVRLSTNGGSTNVGTSATDRGDFTTVLLDINPDFVPGEYPLVWTQFSVTLNGLPAGNTVGRIAFRYFATNGGPDGANSDYIGVDTVTLNGDVGVADLSITKTDGQASAVPGSTITYTIVASNAGPNDAPGATVTDTLAAGVVFANWTCAGAGGGTCTANGTGSITDTVNLPVGGSVTYTLSAYISGSATGTFSNTASVTSPYGDPDLTNNSATDTDTLTPMADLMIVKTDDQAKAPPGSPITYRIQAGNAGPSDAPGAIVTDTLPAAITGATWTCVGVGVPAPGTCSASGSGSINDTVNLPAGGFALYTLTGTVSPSATGSLSNTATVTAPGGVTDPNLANNSATDTDVLVGLDYFTLPPCRLVDTRGGAPISGPVLQGQATQFFGSVAGYCGIPSSAKALSINLTVTQSTAQGNVRLFPAGQPVPTASSINYAAGQTRANNVIVLLNSNSTMATFTGQPAGTTAHMIIDVTGYFE